MGPYHPAGNRIYNLNLCAMRIDDLHPCAKTLASRIIDAQKTDSDKIQADSLNEIEKRFLFDKGIDYSLNPETRKWEIIL